MLAEPVGKGITAEAEPAEPESSAEHPGADETMKPDSMVAGEDAAPEAVADTVVAEAKAPEANPHVDGIDNTKPSTVERVGPETETARAVVRPQPESSSTVESESAPTVARFEVSIVDAEDAPGRPRLINIIGTIFFGFFDTFAKLIAGPIVVPPNSTVRVGRSSLEIDCGDGYVAQADWYVPTGPEPPVGLIYFQHGFGTQAGFYNVTLAGLAESTNSIVVAPSITSNFFACDSCHLTGDPMHFAVAKLFSGDRAALTASLAAAFGAEQIALPEKYVLVGHSGGSSMVAGVAGFASQLEGAGGSSDLAGVILFETNDIGEFVSRGIAKVPVTTPVYYVGGDPAVLNNFDEVNAVMQKLRPGQFTGFRLIGGVHTDVMKTTNKLVAFASSLLLGFPKKENAAAANLLASRWIIDMFSTGADVGVYAPSGAPVDIETGVGTAHAVALGGSLYQPTVFQSFVSFIYGLLSNLQFGYCAADVEALVAAELEPSTCTG